MLAFAPGFDQTFDQQMYNNLPDKIWKVCKNGLCVICTWPLEGNAEYDTTDVSSVVGPVLQ